MEEESRFNSKTSRRDALKKIGAGSALIWSAPALTSLGQAVAQQGESPPRAECTDNLICGVVFSPCGQDANGTCSCTRGVEGDFLCGNDGCGPACTTSADCQSYAAGSICQAPGTGCCGQVCIAPCGAFGVGAGAHGGGSNSKK